MEDDLNIFNNGRRSQFFKNGRQIKPLENGRRNQYCGKCKTTSIFFPKEGDLYYLENGRQPQLFGNIRWPDYFDDWSTFISNKNNDNI
jgi:hypothetical protein